MWSRQDCCLFRCSLVPGRKVAAPQRPFSREYRREARSRARRQGRGQASALGPGEVALPLGRDPPRLPLEHEQFPDHGLDGRNDLGGRRSGAHDGHHLVGQLVVMLPPCGVECGTLEGLETRPLGIPGHVEEADGTDEHMALVDRAGAEGDRPDVPVVVPGGRLDGRAQPQVREEPELVDRLLEVGLQLRLAGMGAGPVVGLEREAVEVRAHVDFSTGIGVVPPGAADAGRGFVDREGVDPGPSQLHAGGDPSEPGSHHDDLRGPGRSEQLAGGGAPPHLGRARPWTQGVAPDGPRRGRAFTRR